MPIYEYKCNKCGENFEKLVFSSDDEREFICDSCGEKKLSRTVSSFSKGPSSSGAGLGSISESNSCGGPSSGFS